MLWLIEVCRRLVVGSCCGARPVERGLDLLPGAGFWLVVGESKVPAHLWVAVESPYRSSDDALSSGRDQPSACCRPQAPDGYRRMEKLCAASEMIS